MEKLELKVGSTYRAKKPAKYFRLEGEVFNDRTIIWMSETCVQYDGPAVKIGRNYPTVTHEQFLKWAGSEVIA